MIRASWFYLKEQDFPPALPAREPLVFTRADYFPALKAGIEAMAIELKMFPGWRNNIFITRFLLVGDSRLPALQKKHLTGLTKFLQLILTNIAQSAGVVLNGFI